jgi:hypothetical protein
MDSTIFFQPPYALSSEYSAPEDIDGVVFEILDTAETDVYRAIRRDGKADDLFVEIQRSTLSWFMYNAESLDEYYATEDEKIRLIDHLRKCETPDGEFLEMLRYTQLLLSLIANRREIRNAHTIPNIPQRVIDEIFVLKNIMFSRIFVWTRRDYARVF